MQSESEAVTIHIVDKFVVDAPRDRPLVHALCGERIYNSKLRRSSTHHKVDWNSSTYPFDRVQAEKNLCANCVKVCKREWWRKAREHKSQPNGVNDCKNILNSIKNSIARTDDLEELAKLGEELRVTSNRYYKTTIPALLYKEQEGNCALCGEHQRNPKNMALDHIVPRAKGGPSTIENLQIACQACNEEKGTRDNDEFLKHLKRSGRIVSTGKSAG